LYNLGPSGFVASCGLATVAVLGGVLGLATSCAFTVKDKAIIKGRINTFFMAIYILNNKK
jgi:hypothetical protein